MAISKGFAKREAAGQIFPYLANPKRPSSRFRVGGGNCFGKFAAIDKAAMDPLVAVAAAAPEPEPEPSTGHCDGNCGKGKGRGGGNGTADEGGGNGP